MNSFFNDDFTRNFFEIQKEQIEKRDREALKEIFKNKIKISFMFKVLRQIQKITKHYETIIEYYPGFFKLDPFSILLSTENVELDLCWHITGIHTFNMLLIDEYQRGLKQQSQKYIEELAETVLQQVKVRRYGSMLFRKRKLFGEDDFLYYPPVYNLHVLLIYLITTMNNIQIEKKELNIKNDKDDLLSIFLVTILSKARAVISVIDYDSLESGYPILRNIIEMYLIYLSFKYSNADINEYLKFNHYKVDYDEYFEFPIEFEKEYLKNGNGVNKIAYLNYGWLDSIFEFEYLGIHKSYNFSDVVKLVNQLIYKNRNEKSYASNFEIYYKKCHYYSHANLFGSKYPIIYIMDLCKGLGDVLLGIAYEINKIKKLELFENIDIVKNAKLSIERLHKIKEDLNIEQLEKYYNNRN